MIFWVWYTKKNFGKTLEQRRCFGIIIGQFWSFCDFGKFKKSGIFSIFGQIWQLFFFKIRFWTKLVLESLKMVFLTFFRSWRLSISIFYPILSFQNFEFSCIFYVEFCRFRQFWRNMKELTGRFLSQILLVMIFHTFLLFIKLWVTPSRYHHHLLLFLLLLLN